MSKVLIIGGGVAGLSAGIYARLHGHEAVVCEKHTIPGGNLTGWSRGEYHIDNCIHWLTGTNPSSALYEMWVELGALGDGIGVVQGNSLITCERDGKSLSLYCSLDKIKAEMLALSPEDEREINRLINAIELVMALDHIAGEDCNEGITLPRLLRGIGPALKYYKLTTGQLAKRFKSPALQCFITGFWGNDFGAYALLFVFATYCGRNGALPKGGSLKMAERMTERFKSLDGALKLKKEAVHVNLDGNRAVSVVFADGSTESADYIVMTTDAAITFGKLLDRPMPEKLKKLYDDPKMRRFSAYHTAFACDLAEIPFEGDLIFDVPKEYVDILHTEQVILREFSHEPSYAPEGKNILQTMTFCFEKDCNEFIRLRREDKEAYKAKKEQLSSILQMLIEEHCPSLRGRLTIIDVWTPASYERFIGSQVGSFMSFALPESHIPVCLDGSDTGVDNLLLATQWQQSPGGLPIAAECGKKAIETISEIEKKKQRSKKS